MLICTTGVLILVEGVLVAVIVRPDEVAAACRRLDAWVRRNGWTLIAALALTAGIYAITKGIDLLA